MRALLLGTYGLMGALGVGLVVSWESAAALPAGTLLLGIAVGGVHLMLVLPALARRRPAVGVGTAPSGLPATFLRRRSDVVVSSVVVTLALAGWVGWVAGLLAARGRPAEAVALGAFGLVLLVPCLAAAAGKVPAGGLWLTAAGLEHRRETTTWAVFWTDVEAVRALPAAGLLPVEPVVLRLRPGARPQARRTARWLWKDRTVVPTPGTLVVDTFGLAGDQRTVAELIAGHLVR